VLRTIINRLEKFGSTVPIPIGIALVALLILATAVPIALGQLYVLNGEIVDNAVLVITITCVTVATPILVFIFLTIRSLETSRNNVVAARTELNERIVELANARLEAETANRAKSAFLAQMSHELRTPLNAVMGFSEVLMHRELVNPNMTMADVAKYGDMIHHSGSLLLSLVNDVLDISKIESGKLQLSPVAIRLGDAIEGARDCITVMLEKRCSELTLDNRFADLEFMADRRALDQMLLNLLSNAVKFSPDQSVVTLGVALDDDGLSIKVSNPGRGMTPDEIEKAVDPFTQVSSALVTSEKGTGLGLTIVRSLIELEGGDLYIESTPDVETSVTIRYPYDSIISSEYQAVSNA